MQETENKPVVIFATRFSKMHEHFKTFIENNLLELDIECLNLGFDLGESSAQNGRPQDDELIACVTASMVAYAVIPNVVIVGMMEGTTFLYTNGIGDIPVGFVPYEKVDQSLVAAILQLIHRQVH